MLLDDSFEEKTLIDTEDLELNKNIHEFWAWVLSNLPDKLHMLRAPIPRTVITAFDRVEKLDAAVSKYQQAALQQAPPQQTSTQPAPQETPEQKQDQSKE